MNLAELQPKQGKVDVTVDITEMSDARTFNKFGKEGRVCNAKIKDESGEMTLSLWNEQIDMVDVGDKIHITNGYVNEYQGERQLTAGRFGKIEVVEKGNKEQLEKEVKKQEEEYPATEWEEPAADVTEEEI
jgi:replication factor A1